MYTALAFAVCVVITGMTYLLELPELRNWAITSAVGLMYVSLIAILIMCTLLPPSFGNAACMHCKIILAIGDSALAGNQAMSFNV